MKPYVLCVCVVLLTAFCGLGNSTLQSLFDSNGASYSGGGTSFGYAAGSSFGTSTIADYQRDKQFRKWSK